MGEILRHVNKKVRDKFVSIYYQLYRIHILPESVVKTYNMTSSTLRADPESGPRHVGNTPSPGDIGLVSGMEMSIA